MGVPKQELGNEDKRNMKMWNSRPRLFLKEGTVCGPPPPFGSRSPILRLFYGCGNKE